MLISIESPRQDDVLELLRLSDEFAWSLYPAESCYLLDVSELEAPGVRVFVARAGAADARPAGSPAEGELARPTLGSEEHGMATLAAPPALTTPAALGMTALGMAALVGRADGSAEIKRMFVSEAARGSGVGRALLGAVIGDAEGRGIRLLQLETGPLQPEAIALYRSAGFEVIPNFGPYVGDEFSVCMERRAG